MASIETVASPATKQVCVSGVGDQGLRLLLVDNEAIAITASFVVVAAAA